MLRFFLRPTKDRRSIDKLDYKLVKQAQKRGLPSPSQIKYLFHFLSKKEKLFFVASFVVTLIGVFSISAALLSKHLDFVPADGGEYSEALIGQPKYINPIFASVNDVDQDLSSLAYAGLFRFGQNQAIEPYIAESYSISTDTKSYFIKLRKDVYFADKTQLTANDVAYTFDLIQNPETASPLSAAFRGVKIEIEDDFTLKFTLKEPFAPFLESLTVGILPEHIWSEMSPNGIRLAKNNLQPMGAGPWQFNKIVKDSTGRIDSITLSRNDNFFEKKPFFKTLRFKFFDEYGSAVESLKSQSIDAVSFFPDAENSRINNKNIIFYKVRFPEYSALFFNETAAPLLKDSDVRLALAKSIDKINITENVLGGNAVPIDSPFLPGSLGYSNDIKKIIFNPTEAVNILDKKWTRLQPEEYFNLRQSQLIKELESNQSASSTTSTAEINEDKNRISEFVRSEMDQDQTFYRKDKDNNILQITITTGDSNDYSRVAEAIAKEWRKIGVRVSIEKTNFNQLLRGPIRNRDYDVLLYSEITGSDPDPFPFWHSSQTQYPGLNLAGFSDRNADKLLEDSRVISDTATRSQNYIKFQNILAEEVPAVFLYSPWHVLAINKEVKGISLSSLNIPSDRFSTLSNWYVNTKLKWK